MSGVDDVEGNRRIYLNKMKFSELGAECKAAGVAAGGSKGDMIARILAAPFDGDKKALRRRAIEAMDEEQICAVLDAAGVDYEKATTGKLNWSGAKNQLIEKICQIEELPAPATADKPKSFLFTPGAKGTL